MCSNILQANFSGWEDQSENFHCQEFFLGDIWMFKLIFLTLNLPHCCHLTPAVLRIRWTPLTNSWIVIIGSRTFHFGTPTSWSQRGLCTPTSQQKVKCQVQLSQPVPRWFGRDCSPQRWNLTCTSPTVGTQRRETSLLLVPQNMFGGQKMTQAPGN